MHLFDEMTEPELKELFAALAGAMTEALPPKTAFIIMATPFGDGRAPWQYVSNAERETIREAFEELLERWGEPGHEIPR